MCAYGYSFVILTDNQEAAEFVLRAGTKQFILNDDVDINPYHLYQSSEQSFPSR